MLLELAGYHGINSAEKHSGRARADASAGHMHGRSPRLGAQAQPAEEVCCPVTRPGLAAAASLRGGSAGGARALARALEAAAAAISRYGGAAEGDRTMIDALAPAARALQEAEAAGARPKPLCMGRSPAGGCAARRAPLASR